MKTVLKNRSVMIIGIAESVSGLGNWITVMAVFALVIFRNNGSTAQSSGLFMAFLLPLLFASPLAGKLVDRFDRKKLMIASELLSACTITALIFAESMWLIYVLLAVQSTFASVMQPARQAAIPNLVRREDLTKVNALLQQLASVIKIMGPMLAGLLLVVMEPQMTLIIDVVTFVLSALILGLLPALPAQAAVDQAEEDGTEKSAAGEETVPDLLRRVPALLAVFVMIFLGVMVIMSFDVLSAIYVRDVLEADESFMGLIIGLIGLGAVISTALLMLRQEETSAGQAWRDILVALTLLGLIPAALAIAPMIPGMVARRAFVIVMMLIGGLGNGMTLVQVSTLLQLLSPEYLLGRVSGAFQMTLVGGQVITLFVLPFIVPGLLQAASFFGLAAGMIFILALAGTMMSGTVAQHAPLVEEAASAT